MKNRHFFLGILLIFIIFFNSVFTSTIVNLFSIGIIDRNFIDNNKVVEYFFKFKEKRICQIEWLTEVLHIHDFNLDKNNNKLIELISCSSLYPRMMRAISSDNKELALIAMNVYQDDLHFVYWLANSIDDLSAKKIYLDILQKYPNEGLAWRYLAILYEKENEIDSAISANVNSCTKGDPTTWGCYYAGKLYEGKGEIDKAIKYYGMSSLEMGQWAHKRLLLSISK